MGGIRSLDLGRTQYASLCFVLVTGSNLRDNPCQGFIPKAIVDIATDPQPMLIHTVACALDKDTTGRFKVRRLGVDYHTATPSDSVLWLRHRYTQTRPNPTRHDT